LPIKIIIFNNGALGFVELEMKAAGFLNFGTDLQNPDFGAMANAMGIYGKQVTDPGDLAGVLRDAFAHPGPALIDVVTNRMELVMPPAIKAEQMKGFSLYAARAIMDGRGMEVFELAKTNLWR
jgi:pyruvate dehydrogenase (quinone)